MKVEGINGSGTVVSKKPLDRVEKLEKEVANVTMATRITQMLLKQIMEQLETIKSDMRQNTSMINDYQYRFLGLQSATKANVAEVSRIADELKLVDWNQASERQDREGSYQDTDTITSDQDTVVLTSTTPDVTPDAGIFRSRTVLAETGNKDLVAALMGKKVGEKTEFVLNGTKHIIELLNVKVKQQQDSTQKAAAQ